jgi:hypothetical protein
MPDGNSAPACAIVTAELCNYHEMSVQARRANPDSQFYSTLEFCMAIEFECPNGHKLKAPEERAGKAGKCPKCGVDFIVPSPQIEPEPESFEEFEEEESQWPEEGLPGGESPSGDRAESPTEIGKGNAPIAHSVEVQPGKSAPEETISFLCPNGHKLTSPVSLQGRAGKCPHCGEKFRVPTLEELHAEEEIEDFGVDEGEGYEFGNSEEYAGGEAGFDGGQAAEDFDAEIPDDALEEDWSASPYPARRLFEHLWIEREHGGRIRISVAEGEPVIADFYARRLSQSTHGVFASRDEKGNYRIIAIAWDAIRRIEVDELVNLPDDVFE